MSRLLQQNRPSQVSCKGQALKINSANIEQALPKDSMFRRWLACYPTEEAPKSYILFSGLAMLGAAFGRKVWFDQGHHKIRPMLNILLIGPSGIGKSTAISMGEQLLRKALPGPEERPQIIRGTTQEQLHFDLSHKPHALLVASELANFFGRQKYMEGMIPYITELLDYGAEIEKRTRSAKVVTVYEPSVTVIGGSTVEWLQEQLPDSATSGGFLARFLIVSEEHRGQRVAHPARVLNRKQTEQLEVKKSALYDEFYRCLHAHSGEIDYDGFEAQDVYTTWYATYTAPTGHLAPFAARAGEMVLRLAVLMALSCQHTAIKAEDMRAAIALYEYIANKLQAVVVPFSASGKMLAQVLQLIGPQGMKEEDIYKNMRNVARADEIERILHSLMRSKDIVLVEGKFIRTR